MKQPFVRLFALIAPAALFIPIAAAAQPDPCQLEDRVRVQHGNLIDGVLSVSPSIAAAEHFSLPVEIEILSIGWLGGSLSGAPGASFVITIYQDLEGLPDASSGVVVFSAAPDQALDTGNLISGAITEWNYCAELPTSFVAAANQTYWMEVRASDGIVLWGWEKSTNGNGFHAVSNSGNWAIDTGDLAFSLYSLDVIPVIPILPALAKPTMAWLAMTLAGVALMTDRKRLGPP